MARDRFARFVCVFALGLVGCDGALEGEARAAFEGELEEAAATAEALDQQQRDALRALMAGPEPTITPCDPDVMLYEGGIVPSASFRLDHSNGNLRLLWLDDLPERRGLRMDEVHQALETYRRRLRPGAPHPLTEDSLPRIRERLAEWRDPERWYRHEITHVFIERAEAHDENGVPVPAHLTGRIAVFDYVGGEIVCAAQIVTLRRRGEPAYTGDLTPPILGFRSRTLEWRNVSDGVATIGIQDRLGP